MTDRSVVLDTPEQIALFHWLQVKYALRIEIRTGLRHSRGSVLNQANKMLKADHRTKQAALDAVEAKIAELTKAITEDPA